MKSERIKELQDFSNDFYLKLQEAEKTPNSNESKNNRSFSQRIKKSYSTLNSAPQIKTNFTGNIPSKKGLNSKKNKK